MGGKGNLLQAIAGAAMFFFGPAGGWVASLGRSLLASVVLGAVGKALQKKPSASGTTMAAQGRLETVRQALGPRQVVYGRVRVGGTLTFFETTTDNQTALMITTLTGHPVSNIRDVYYNDRSTLDYGSHGSGSAAGGKFAGYSTVYRSSGTEGASQPFGDLVARGLSWAATDLQRDCAKVHSTHAFSNEVWQTGLPQVSCVIDGVFDIIDPRLGSPTGTRWTNNPALCIAHYLASVNGLSADYGSEIDQATLIASANICDERVLLSGTRTATVADVQPSADAIVLAVGSVHFDFGDGLRFSTGSPTTLPGGISEGVTYYAMPVMEGDVTIGQYLRIATSYENAMAGSFMDISSTGSGTITVTHYDEPRYRLNGAFSLTEKPQAVIERMLMAMAGKLVNSGGVWYLYAGAYSTPTLTFDEDDFAGPIDVQTNLSRSENANAVKGTFVDPSSRYQPVDFPAVLSQTYYQEDGGERVYRDLDLTAFVTSSTQAQRLAKIDLITTRVGLTCHARFKLSAFRMMTGATVAISNTHLGWTAKAFEVMNCTLVIERDGRLEVDATLRETAAEIYDWNVSEEQLADLAPNTNLPDPTTVAAPTGLTAVQSSSVWDTVELTVTAPSDSFVSRYQFEYRLVEPGSPQTGEWTVQPAVNDPYDEVKGLLARTYQFRAKAINTFGASSEYTSIVELDAVPPANNYLGSLTGTGSLVLIDQPITGTVPVGIGFSPRTNEIIVSSNDGRIYFHNAATGLLITLPDNPNLRDYVDTGLGSPQTHLRAMVYCPSNGYFYCPAYLLNKAVVFDPATRSIVATITLTGANGGRGGCFSATNGKIYLYSYGSGIGYLNEIDPDTNSITGTVSNCGGVYQEPAYCPVNNYIYAPDITSTDEVQVINPSTLAVITTISLTAPTAAAYCGYDQTVYVSAEDRVVVINPLTNTIVATIMTATGSPTPTMDTRSILYCQDSQMIYVINENPDNISVISPVSRSLLYTVQPSTFLQRMTYVPTTKTIVASNYASAGKISRFSV
jgi:DNA-binding beta-propeller fold protein YncE